MKGEAVHGALSGMIDGSASLMTAGHASYEGVPFAKAQSKKKRRQE